MQDYGFTKKQFKFLKSLNSPEKIQDFIDTLEYNFCDHGYDKPYVCKSPRRVLEEKNAHCLEGSLLAAASLRINGEPPLVMSLGGLDKDDHVLALFKRKELWGAISQSQYYTYKWRDPIFKNCRELALSFFPVYVSKDIVTLRTYSVPINLEGFDNLNWMSTNNDLKWLGEALDDFPTESLVPEGLEIRKVPEELDDLTKKYFYTPGKH